MARSRTWKAGTLSAFRRPFITDPIFWIALGLSLAIGAFLGVAVYALTGGQATVIGMAVPVVCGVVGLWLAFKLLAMGMNTGRALEEAEPASEPRAQALESKGRSAGAVAGRGAAALFKRKAPGQPAPPPAAAAPAAAPAPTPAEEAAPVTLDASARVLGSMVGRRLAARRKDEGS